MFDYSRRLSYILLFALLVTCTYFAIDYLLALHFLQVRETDFEEQAHAFISEFNSKFLHGETLGTTKTIGLAIKRVKSFINKDSSLTASLRKSLQTIRKGIGASHIYILDQNGDCVLSVQDEDAKSFENNNYGFRPYFINAIKGTPYIYAAVGVTSHEPGIYYSAPIYKDNDDKVIGVVVTKITAAGVTAFFRQNRNVVMMLSPQGIVFAANDQNLVFRKTRKLSPQTMQTTIRNRQFPEKIIKSNDLLDFKLDKPVLMYKNQRYLHLEMPVKLKDSRGRWSILLFHNVTQAVPTFVKTMMLVFCVLIYALVFTIYGIFLKHRHEKTERHKLVIQAAETYESVFNSVNEAIFIIDPKTMKIADVNKQVCNLYETVYEAIVGKTLFEFNNEEAEEHCQLVHENLMPSNGNGFKAIEWHSRKQNGSLFWASVVISSGMVSGSECLLVSVRDITEQKNAQNLLRKQKEDLEKLTKELTRNQAQLLQSEKMASIGHLAAGVAHEINNPLGFIMNNLGTLQRYAHALILMLSEYERFSKSIPTKDISPEAKQSIEKLVALKEQEKVDFILEDINALLSESINGSERVRDIVSNLRTFSSVGRHGMEKADVNEGIKSTLKIVWNELKLKCNVIEKLSPLPLTKCNLAQLDQVFVNLLINAAQAIREKGDITIESYAENGKIIIKISDTGEGIAQKNLSDIFNPFFTTHDIGKGSGLGLSVCHSIIKNHDGEINVESLLGKGTTFTIILPIKP